ncbi:YdcF family protein [Isobaculum melis]|uniref:Uncharacterized SAM-binding protein YcdF, DUF218 family n=1 Tax=Isobaculum melis TaxID=142588 RepID=A0A1H9UHU2_9LACT|nr:YdcF family protein [Isobaculum melis]SES09006.1 Uncharacterized SAM-binding protein YcdF, DUF218 family [Isobaculum melis]
MLLYGVPAFFFLIFLISYLQDRRKIINGFLFNLFLFTALISFIMIAYSSQNAILVGISLIIMIVGVMILLFGAFILMVASFWNARIVMKKEGRSPANLLTLFLGIGILAMLMFSFFNVSVLLPANVTFMIAYVYLVILYFFFIFVNFLVASLIYQFYSPKKNKDFVIVLGSGLINGEIVPPLLAARINKAINFYHKQEQVTTPPKLLFSGGQGPDEKLSEATAMQKYALLQGIPFEDTLIEDQSRNSFENMSFSKKIMDDRMQGKPYKSIFSTNNYHLFRAGLYAKKAGLKSQGIGAKTALYFWPNAMLREFIAVVMMHKKWHIILLGLVGLMFLAMLLISNEVIV